MGIKNVNETATEHCSSAFFCVPVTKARNKRVAMDSPIWLYARISNALGDVVRRMKDLLEDIDRTELISKCLNATLRFHCDLLDENITLVWFKDGVSPK